MSQDGAVSGCGPSSGRAKVVTLVDWDNFYTNCVGRGMDIDSAVLKTLARSVGRPLWSAVFVDVKRLGDHYRTDLFQNGFDIVDCPRVGTGGGAVGKDLVDAKIIERMHMLAEHLDFDILLLASFDKDFLLTVQFIRDTGRKVFIIAPTSEDRTQLISLADDVVVYNRGFSSDSSPLSRVAEMFEQKEFHTADKTVLRQLVTLREIVQVLMSEFDINSNRFNFHAVIRKAGLGLEARNQSLDSDETRKLVSFLVSHNVLARTSVKSTLADDGDEDQLSGGPVCYRVDEEHAFVRLNLNVLKEAAGLLQT